jgi:hypothetical protein
MQDDVKVQGIPVRIGTRDLIMPSLSVSQAERFWPTILELDRTGATKEEMKDAMSKKFHDIVEMIQAALSRNYPDVTVEQLKDAISISQIKSLVLILMGQSGLEMGESQPVAEKRVVH